MFCTLGFILELRFVAFVIRAIAACAMFAPPGPRLPDTACNGVFAPVELSEDGGTMFPEDSLSNEGNWGSEGIEPSSCSPRSLRSSRLTCRSNCDSEYGRLQMAG